MSRAGDVVVALPLAIMLAPLMGYVTVRCWLSRRAALETRLFCGHRGPLRLAQFSIESRWRYLPRLFDVLAGKLAFVGSEPVAAASLVSRLPRALARPGFVTLYGVRRRMNIAFEPVEAVNREYTRSRSFARNIGLVVRGAIAALFAGRPGEASSTLRLLGVSIDNVDVEQSIEQLAALAGGERAATACFVNAHCLNVAVGDDAYRGAIDEADLVLADGIGVHLAARLSGQRLRANVNGTDLIPLLCQRLATDERSVFFLGGRPGVAAAAARRLTELAPGLRVAGARDGYFERDERAVAELVTAINDSGADVLLVAMGVPLQELWIARQRGALRPALAVGVGGLFDFYSGTIPRAPSWVRELGCEWLYRLRQEPRRMWRRYVLGNPLFLARIALRATLARFK